MQSFLQDLGEASNLDISIVDPRDEEGLQQKLPGADVLWHVLHPFGARDIERAQNLKLIHKFGVGVNTIDVDHASMRRVAVCNMPGSNSQAVAECALNLMLSCLRHAPWVHGQTVSGQWNLQAEKVESIGELRGRTVGLVGYGGIPRILAPVLLALGSRVVYTARAEKADAEAEFMELEELLAESDIVSLHVPLTDETKLLLDRGRLALMKPEAIIVNTARGGLVDQDCLYEMLESGRLAAAGLDVFSEEPVNSSEPLLRLETVVVAPHLAWHTRETLERSAHLAVENCRRLRDDEPLENQVNQF